MKVLKESYNPTNQTGSVTEFQPQLPGEDLLVRRLVYSLTFAKNTLNHLIIEDHPAPEDAPWFVKNEKIIAETAFLVAFSRNNICHSQVQMAFAELIQVLEPLARSESMLLNVCLRPGLAIDYAEAHICLDYAGYPNAQFDRALCASLESSAANSVERTPHRMMEAEWLKRLWKKGHKGDMNFWTRLSCLLHPVDVFSENADGAYSITHAIMYGAFEEKLIPGIDTERLFQMIEALLIRYLDEQNYDVAAELLIAWPLLSRKWSPTAVFALHCIFKIEDRVGFLPAPGLEREKIDGAEQMAKRTYIYSINYHTALVMGLLCNAILENPVGEEVVSLHGNYPDKWRQRIEQEIYAGKDVHWKEFYRELDTDQKENLLPMLYQVCLIRWIRKKQYGNVSELLDCADAGLQNLEASRQAKELLHRLSIIAEGIA